jgi:small subunit ribosomal protein S18
MARARTPRRKSEDRDRRPKKKVSILDAENVGWVDYKDVNLLRRFMSERAKIRARRVTGNDAQQQRAVSRAIRVAREMALLPYSVRQVTHRSKGKGRERGGSDDRSASRDEIRAVIDEPGTEGAPEVLVGDVLEAPEAPEAVATDAFGGTSSEGDGEEALA